MRLTSYTDYCVRVLMYLGLQDDRLCTITEIADRYGISRNHLMKVVYGLARMGYIDTVRGKNGGMRLQRRPDEINLGELVRRTERDLELVECFGASSTCRLTPVCMLRGVLGEALQAFLDVLDGYTLTDLLGPGHRLAALLAIETEMPDPNAKSP